MAIALSNSLDPNKDGPSVAETKPSKLSKKYASSTLQLSRLIRLIGSVFLVSESSRPAL